MLAFLPVLTALLLPASAQDSSSPPVVQTTFYPTTWLAERIGGDLVEVICPTPADADPIFWRPDRTAMAGYLAADLVILNGARFEKWVLTADLPRSTTIDTARGFRDQWIEFEEGVTHSHGNEGEHSHVGIDGHTWLDPMLMIEQGRAIVGGLKKIRPGQAATLDARFERVKEDLLRLHQTYKELGALPEGEFLVTSHPAYNYLARRYGWRVVSLDFDPEELPSDEALEHARSRIGAATGRAKVILWEAPPTDEVNKRVEEGLGLRGIVISPCEMLDPSAQAEGVDYLKVMEENVARLRTAFPAVESEEAER